MLMTRLPMELWLNIASHYTADDRQIAQSLCLVSRSLLPLGRALLYSNLLRKDLRKEALLNTLSNGPNAKAIAACVREVAVENCLCMQRVETPVNLAAVAGTGGEVIWTALDVKDAQEKVRARWDRTVKALQFCVNIVKMTFVLDCEDAQRLIGTTTVEDEDPLELVPMPTVESLLQLPFLPILQSLSIYSPNDTDDTDYKPFAHLAMVCPQLTYMAFGGIEATIFFETILQRMKDRVGHLALSTVVWDETSPRNFGPPMTFDEALIYLTDMPSVTDLTYIGPAIDYGDLQAEHHQGSVCLPSITSLTILEQEPEHTIIRREILRDLATYFPSLRQLAINLKHATRYPTLGTCFPNLLSLSVTERKGSKNGKIRLAASLLHLSTRSFAPALKRLDYRVSWGQTPSDLACQIVSAEMEMKQWAKDSVGKDLKCLRIRQGNSQRLFLRQGDHFVLLRRGASTNELS